MWPLLIALAVGVAACSSQETPPAPRRRPDHPDGGTPADDPDAADPIDGGNEGGPSDAGNPTDEAREKIGDHFDLFVHADRAGREGCGTISVENIIYSPVDGGNVSLSARARWASFPSSFLDGGQVSSEVAYRSGDFPVSFVTEEYPEYGTLGLKYLVTGTYDPEGHQMRILLQNIDAESGEPSGVFLSPVYQPSGGDTCRASEDMENEFFVATTAREVTLPVTEGGGSGNLCSPCDPPVEEISYEISPRSAR